MKINIDVVTNEIILFHNSDDFQISNETWKFSNSPCPTNYEDNECKRLTFYNSSRFTKQISADVYKKIQDQKKSIWTFKSMEELYAFLS